MSVHEWVHHQLIYRRNQSYCFHIFCGKAICPMPAYILNKLYSKSPS